MRTLLIALLSLLLAAPSVAGPTLKVKLDKKHSFTLSVDPTKAMHTPEFMGFVVSTATDVLVETKGDPMIYIGGKFLGYWPSKHVTYAFRSGVKITGHATSKNGNPQSFEIWHTDGTMTRITGADTVKPSVKKYSRIGAWLWKKAYEKPSFELPID